MLNILVLGAHRLRRPQRLRKAGRALAAAPTGGSASRRGTVTRARHLQLLPTVEIEVGDVHDDAALARMLRGTDAVINLVADPARQRSRVRARPRAPAGSASRAACRRPACGASIHVSALGAAVDAPSRYLRSKARGEAALRGAGLDLTVLRPSVIFGERDRFLNLFASLQSIFPVLPLAGAGGALPAGLGRRRRQPRSRAASTTRRRSA